MTKISWCLKQKQGIEIVEPNDNLSKAYFTDADNSLKALEKDVGTWKVIMAYYACYNAFYALCMKVGIKCEIHDCTLELMKLFRFSEEEQDFMKTLKKTRVDVQYYLEPAPEINFSKVKSFVTKCKDYALSLHEDKVKEIRGLVKNG